jgi:hypothetical protein
MLIGSFGRVISFFQFSVFWIRAPHHLRTNIPPVYAIPQFPDLDIVYNVSRPLGPPPRKPYYPNTYTHTSVVWVEEYQYRMDMDESIAAKIHHSNKDVIHIPDRSDVDYHYF